MWLCSKEILNSKVNLTQQLIDMSFHLRDGMFNPPSSQLLYKKKKNQTWIATLFKYIIDGGVWNLC